LSFKVILIFKSILKPIKLKETIKDNKNIIIINISYNKNKRGKIQKLIKYIYIYILFKNFKKYYYYY
jgi:hypothetical protein